MGARLMEHPAADFSVFTLTLDMSTPLLFPSLLENLCQEGQNLEFW